MMPDLDGWSVLAALRQDAELAEIPVIMVTIMDEQRRGMALGAAGYLTKPIDRERLTALVGRFRSPARPTRSWSWRTIRSSASACAPGWSRSNGSCAEAANGDEALTCLRKDERPDLILLDLMMPEMDGFQLVARLAEGARLARHSGHRHHRNGS